jgi:DNA-nicking Smr family endonuclease
MSGGRRPRRLTPEEMALWRKVTETAEPLPGTPPVASPPAPSAVSAKEAPASAEPVLPAAPPPARRGRPVAPTPPSLAAMDRRTRHKVARGTVALDARLDLHGLTQQVAHERLYAFLASMQQRGGRLVLVITGKGGIGDEPGPGGERGVLRRSVPHWLASERFRPLVIGFDEAARGHGGAGAIYVRLRRRRG